MPAVKNPVTVVSRSATSLTLATDPSSKGLLVVSELYYPGWQAYVDGRKVDTVKADLMLRGVMLAGGQHRIEFRYEARVVLYGAIISLAVAVLLILYGAVLLLRRRASRRKRETVEAISDNTGA